MRSDLHLSISKIIPISRMLTEVTAPHSRPNTTVNEGCLHDELQLQVRRFGTAETNFWLAAATILDPRFKKVPFANESMADQAQKRLETETCSDRNLTEPENFDEPTGI